MPHTERIIVPYTGEALTTGQTAQRYDYTFEFIGKKFQKVSFSPQLNEKGDPVKAEQIDPYLPDSTLREAVELMQILERPLLLRGEPGCGKTRVAQAYAYERYKDEPGGYRRFYFEWHVKSASKAQDGLYRYDHIARLRDAKKEGDDDAPEDKTRYRELGPLGKAFLASEPGKPAILLIDEIDKADIDFPNDLLLELDEMRFDIPETGEEIIPRQRPLIFITSNQERELPQAFLRRCLFHFIQFPIENLRTIMLANFPELERTPEGVAFAEKAIDRFKMLRDELKTNPTANKNVSTSELKDWMRILTHYFVQQPDDERIRLEGNRLPFHTALLKTENDLKSTGKT